MVYIICGFVAVAMIYFGLRGAPFVGTVPNRIGLIVKMAGLRSGEKVLELGSGDGRVVVAFANAGAEVHGFELNPILVWYSRRSIKNAGLENRAFIHMRDFWGEDFSKYDVVTVYGIPYIMAKLKAKMQKEMRPGSKVISHSFVFPDWKPQREEDHIMLYKI